MREKILIADDNELNREMLAVFLEDEYEIINACDGEEAVTMLKSNKDTSILLLDLYMPKKDGFAVLQEVKELGLDKTLPVIIISGENSAEVEAEALKMGATDFIHKPFENSIVKRRVVNSIELFSSRNKLEEKVSQQTEEIKAQYEMLKIQSIKLRETNERIIDVLGSTVEFRHMESYEHINRVKAFTKCLANQVASDYPDLGLNDAEVNLIVSASSLHDIGKIAISDSVLLKPGRFTKEEFEYMKTHTTKGCEILKRVDGIWDAKFARIAYDICRHHHERFDGRGYPDGLAGDDIPLSAQIVSVADVYDALICKRVYKEAFKMDEAFNMILNGECGVFSPRLMECFKKCRDELEHLAKTIVSPDSADGQ